ncbi:hypothetical protein E3N88_29836 [Mikania micrantha]|uniref:Uncharacterized protein n=1 Tax=Mikania micrantha TaxID=192012 RepID=A0A5N6MKC7_9ASTR|nr:hypothetical protein E3N88_29836 [Mikania micrantha]
MKVFTKWRINTAYLGCITEQNHPGDQLGRIIRPWEAYDTPGGFPRLRNSSINTSKHHGDSRIDDCAQPNDDSRLNPLKSRPGRDSPLEFDPEIEKTARINRTLQRLDKIVTPGSRNTIQTGESSNQSVPMADQNNQNPPPPPPIPPFNQYAHVPPPNPNQKSIAPRGEALKIGGLADMQHIAGVKMWRIQS